MDALDLMWTEPLSWLILTAAALWIVLDYRRARHVRPLRLLAIGGLGAWLVAAFALTIYPIELEPPAAYRVELQSFVPLWGTIESIANSDGYLLSDEAWATERRRLADDMGIPVEEVRLERRVYGIGLMTAFKDPLGNVVLFAPLGFLAALGWAHMRRWKPVLIAGIAVSASIELSQMLFGLGSLGTIDDVIFNTLGAMIGFGLWLAAAQVAARLPRPVTRAEEPIPGSR